jgi:hypothetical protein
MIGQLERISVKIYTGEFGADMQVKLTNDGPVTIVIDTKIKNESSQELRQFSGEL